jgi:hypothetical protein
MSTISEKIAKLQSLLEHKKQEEQPQVAEVGTLYPAPPQDDAAPAEPILSKQADPTKRPASLEGFSYHEILLFQSLGDLSPEEERWLQSRGPRPGVYYEFPF